MSQKQILKIFAVLPFILVGSLLLLPQAQSFAPFAFIRTLVASWNFGTAGHFTYSGTEFTTSTPLNKASISPLDFTVNTSGEFGAAGSSQVGTSYASSKLSLTGASAQAELASGWTPNWANLVLYLKMNESSWTGTANEVVDSSGLAHHATRYGTPTTSAQSKLGAAAGMFNGSTDYLRIADTNDLDASSVRPSVSVWVKPRSLGKNSVVIEKTSEAYKIETQTDDTWKFQVRNAGATIVNATGGKVTTEWTHVGLVYDGTNLLGYVNGVLVASAAVTTNLYTSAYDFHVGCNSNVSNTCNDGYWDGYIDELAIWKTALTASDMQTIYTRQVAKYAGVYTSPVLDATSTRDWAGLRWTTNLPYGKELPGDYDGDGTPDTETATEYASITPSGENLASGLVGLWHLNGTIGTVVDDAVVPDSSGKGNNGAAKDGDTTNTLQYVQGRFAQGLKFDGVNDCIYIPDSTSLSSTSALSVSVWVNGLDGNNKNIIGQSDLTLNQRAWRILANSSQKWKVLLSSDGVNNDKTYISSGVAFDGQTHHLAFTFNAGTLKLYLDGVEDTSLNKTSDTSITSLFNSTANVGIGCNFDNGGQNAPSSSMIDEAAVWNRALSAAEILQLYRRGANRVNALFRTCDDSACSGETWKGPLDAGGGWFSELHNYTALSSTGDGSGKISLNHPFMDFSKFFPLGLGVLKNRYFQYMLDLESDDAGSACGGSTCYPDVTTVTPVPAFSLVTTVGRSYHGKLIQMDVAMAGSCAGTVDDVRFQLSSDDGTTYQFWNSVTSVWTNVNSTYGDYAQANSKTVINAHLLTFGPATGTLKMKILVPSRTGYTCDVTNPLFRWQ